MVFIVRRGPGRSKISNKIPFPQTDCKMDIVVHTYVYPDVNTKSVLFDIQII